MSDYYTYNQPMNGLRGLGAFNQRRVDVSRASAEHIIQQINGPVNGIERLSDDELQKRLPTQYNLIK